MPPKKQAIFSKHDPYRYIGILSGLCLIWYSTKQAGSCDSMIAGVKTNSLEIVGSLLVLGAVMLPALIKYIGGKNEKQQ